MKTRWWVPAIFLLLALGSGYLTWLSWRAGQDGKWMFGVFTVFFLLLGAVPLAPKFRRQPPAEMPVAGTRFVPHWFMLIALLVFVAALLLAIVGAIRRH